MDGIHDLGGKQGYGAIDVNEPEEPFHNEFDGIGWTINQTTRAPGLSIDWWRYIRELTPPVDYLTRPYFDQWSMTQLIALIDNGQISLDEIIPGPVSSVEQSAEVMSIDQVHKTTTSAAVRFDRSIDKKAKYVLGDQVTTRNFNVKNHTRLPSYAQGKTGIVTAHHGVHMYPDQCSQGNEIAEHLYTIKFSSKTLWPADNAGNDFVYIDLWEPYFV